MLLPVNECLEQRTQNYNAHIEARRCELTKKLDEQLLDPQSKLAEVLMCVEDVAHIQAAYEAHNYQVLTKPSQDRRFVNFCVAYPSDALVPTI